LSISDSPEFAADTTLKDPFHALGMLYEQSRQYDKARAAYEQALNNNPNDVIALNNLAYGIAVRDGKPENALPLADRAFRLSRGSAVVADTLGWITHLLGDDAAALPLIEGARKGDPVNADIALHLAVLYAATGRTQDAAKALQAAKALDPSVDQRQEYQAALKRIGGLSPAAGR
jgi:tetratricopeptide (TPR) repeat protein